MASGSVSCIKHSVSTKFMTSCVFCAKIKGNYYYYSNNLYTYIFVCVCVIKIEWNHASAINNNISIFHAYSMSHFIFGFSMAGWLAC